MSGDSGRVSPSLSLSLSISSSATHLLPESLGQPHSPSSTSSTRSLSSASFSSRGFHANHGTLPMNQNILASASSGHHHSAPPTARRSNSPHSFSDGQRGNLTTSAEKDEEEASDDDAEEDGDDAENRRLNQLSSTGGALDDSDCDDGAAAAAQETKKTHSRQTSTGERLSAYRLKSRTLPNSKTKKRCFTIANRLKTFLSQQKSDGLYCVLTLVNDPIQHIMEIREKEKEKERKRLEEEKARGDEDAAKSESSSSSSDSESSSSSSSSESEADIPPEERELTSQQRKKLRHQRREEEQKKKEELREVAALRAKFHSVFVLNKQGGIFGKQPANNGATSATGFDSSSSADVASSGKKHFLLSDPYVSKKHFKVDADKGRFFISDLGSLNGSFIRRNFSSTTGSGSRVMKSIADQNQGVTVRHEKPYGYRLTHRRVFLLGKGELMVANVKDAESLASDGIANPAQSDYSVTLQYTYRASGASGDQQPAKLKSVKIGSEGARIGKSEECEICIPDSQLDDVHSRLFFLEGKFYLKDLRDDAEVGVWARLSLKGEESSPHLLCSGDMIRVGATEMKVAVRAIPPTAGAGFGAGTAGIGALVAGMQSASIDGDSSIDVGSTLEGNFSIQKEMQDRLVAIRNYGGNDHNGFFAVFDGHQDRTVADFAAASFHHNLLEEIDTLIKGEAGQDKDKDEEEISPDRKALHDDLYDGESRARPQSQTPSINTEDSSAVEPEDTPSASSAHTPRSAAMRVHEQNLAPIQSPAHATQLDLKSAVRTAYLKTTAQIAGMGDAANYGGCTAVTCLLWYFPATRERRLITGNLGDSRAVLCRNGKAVDLTYIHVARDEGEQKRVKDAGGKIAPNLRLAGCLEVTRAFGDLGMVPFGLSSEPYIRETVLQDTDSFLVVSSDGLFDVLTGQEVCEILLAQPPEITAQQLSVILVETALTKKTRDNLSVVVIDLNPHLRQQMHSPPVSGPDLVGELTTPARPKGFSSAPLSPLDTSGISPSSFRTPPDATAPVNFPLTAPATHVQSRLGLDSPPAAMADPLTQSPGPSSSPAPLLKSQSAMQLDQE